MWTAAAAAAAWLSCSSPGSCSSLCKGAKLFSLLFRSVFDWGLKVSFGVFLLKHLWLQLCGQQRTIKLQTPPEITEIFNIKPLNTLFPSESLSAFMSVITLCTVYVYTLIYNKVIINCRISTFLKTEHCQHVTRFWFNMTVVSEVTEPGPVGDVWGLTFIRKLMQEDLFLGQFTAANIQHVQFLVSQ